MHSIRFKITIITIAAILTSALSVIGACYFSIRKESNRNSAEKMNLLSENVKKSLDDYSESIEQSVETVAKLAADSLDGVSLVENGVSRMPSEQSGQTPDQVAKLDAYLADYLDGIQDAFNSVVGGTQGVVSYFYCINPDISRTVHGFYYTKAGKTGFYAQPPLNAEELDPNDSEHSSWYFTSIERGRPSWIGPYKKQYLDDMWTVSYVIPIYKTGTLVGVLGMDIPFDSMVSLVKQVKIYKSGFACLLDNKGHVLYHPKLKSGTIPDIPDQSFFKIVFQEKNSGSKPIRYVYLGEHRQLAFDTLRYGMKIVVTAPVQEIFSNWTNLSRVIFLATVVIIVFYALLVLFAMGIIVRPLQRLTSASRRLAAGDYELELDYTGSDEVGVLTGAFTQMRDHLKLYIKDLNRRIYTDELTGLPNRHHFAQLAETTRLALLEEGRHPAMLFFNVVGLKYYNRQYSFPEGNRLICDVAQILSQSFGMDHCAHFGQGHFAAVTCEENVKEILETIFDQCTKANDHKSLPIQAGIYPYRLETVEPNIACDRAKYACGRYSGSYLSAYCFFDEAMLDEIENYHYIINNLDRALKEEWIQVFYQPIIRTTSGKVCDEEALSRWIDPVRGLLSPGKFIPVLERSRLIYKLDLYVLDHMLLKMQRQLQAGLYLVPQSLNLSRTDFDECDIIEEIRRRVDDAGIPREKLTIELTESVVGRDFDFIRKQINKLQDLGFQVWMDDFGSGYSSLDVLQDIHFDLIKFDMRFMHRFSAGNDSSIILTELFKMAIALGIETVAEGVETEEQVEFLKEVGCTKLQGFYFCRAIPLEEIVERNRKGIQIGYENPEETEYYASMGGINLYDLMAVSTDSYGDIGNYFNTFPMAVIEVDEEHFKIIRSNKSYREFLERLEKYLGKIEPAKSVSLSSIRLKPLAPFIEAVRQCHANHDRVLTYNELADGVVVHAMVQHIAVNPVTGNSACLVVIAGITETSG